MIRTVGCIIAIGCVLGLAAGSVAAVSPAPSGAHPSGASAAVGSDELPLRLESGGLYWAGQTVSFNGSAVVSDVENASIDERTFRIRTVTGDDRAGSLVREFVVAADGEAVLETAPLVGRFVILYEGSVVYVHNGTGYTSAPPDGTSITVGNSKWEVAEQTIRSSWSDDHIGKFDTVNLRIESNRARYRIGVSADGLTFDDLVSMFDSDDFAEDHGARAADGVLLLDSSGVSAYPVTFRELDAGEYTLVIAVTDTDARATATIRIGRVPADPDTSTPTAIGSRSPAPTATPDATEPPRTAPPATTSVTDGPTASPQEPGSTSPPGSTTRTPGQPGFSAVFAVCAVLLGVLVSRSGSPEEEP